MKINVSLFDLGCISSFALRSNEIFIKSILEFFE